MVIQDVPDAALGNTYGNDYVPSLPIAEAAALLGVPESRFRSGWRQSGVVHPVTDRGFIRRDDIVRAAALLALQQVFGEHTPIAVELAKALSPDQLMDLLESDLPTVEVFLPRVQRMFCVGLDPDCFEQIRSGLALRRF